MADEPESLVLVQLRGIRREMATLLERQVRDRELTTKLYNEILAVRSEMQEVRRDVRGLRSEFLRLENERPNRHSEVLEVVRRLDEVGPPTERPTE